MKTLTIYGDIWFVDKICGLIHYKNKKELEIKHVGGEFTYNDFEKEDFEALKFELNNLIKN